MLEYSLTFLETVTMNPNELRVDCWAATCRQTQSHAFGMSLNRVAPWTELIHTASQKFYQQPIPETDDEMSLRQRQQGAVHSVISTITHADNMTRMHQAVASQVFAATQSLVERELPRTADEFSALDSELAKLSMKISSDCHDDTMRRLR